MIQKFQKITAISLCLLMVAGMLASTVSAASAGGGVKKGEFAFASHWYTGEDLTDIYYYTDEVFSDSALDYNEHLATMSMILAISSVGSRDANADHGVRSRNLSHLFREWDFTGFSVNDSYDAKPDERTMGVGMAYKVIGEGENAYTLLAIVPESTDRADILTVGADGVHEGFATGRDMILEFAVKYVEEYGEEFAGEVKVWTVGYSRGAGVANLLAAYLDDHGNALGVELKKENIFAYTFAAPSNVPYADEEEKAALENNYRNIHNRYSAYDIVTYAPFKNWKLAVYGTTRAFDVENAEKKAEMLTFLEKTDQAMYDIYSNADPDGFTALMLQLDLSDGLRVDLVPADPAYGIPDGQRDFLDSRIAFLVDKLVPDRATYVEGGYRYALQCLTSLYLGLDAEQRARLLEGMSCNIAVLVSVYDCCFIADYDLSKAERISSAAGALLGSLPVIEEYLTALSAESENSDWYAFATGFVQTEEYASLKTILSRMASGAEPLNGEVRLVRETMKRFAVGMTARLLGSGVSALTVDEAEREAWMTAVTSEEVAGPLTEFFVYLLLGSDDGDPEPFDPSNKNVSLAVTFLANAERYTSVHNGETILSWLRTEDSYYADEDWHIHDATVKYDENGHWTACACGYQTEACVHAFGDWSAASRNDGERDVVVRRCPCGYEETKEAPKAKAAPPSTTTITLISIGSCMIVACVVTMIVAVKRRKTQK